MIGGVYRLTCKATDRHYIGSSKNTNSRRSAHFWGLRKDKHPSKLAQRDFWLYGEESFEFALLEKVNDPNLLIVREQEWLDCFDGELYNSIRIATSMRDGRVSERYKEHMASSMKGNSFHKGVTMSEESKAAISLSLIGNQYRKGIPHDEETKKRISESLKRAYAEGRKKYKPKG